MEMTHYRGTPLAEIVRQRDELTEALCESIDAVERLYDTAKAKCGDIDLRYALRALNKARAALKAKAEIKMHDTPRTDVLDLQDATYDELLTIVRQLERDLAAALEKVNP